MKAERFNKVAVEFSGREALTEIVSECPAVVKQENFKEVAVDCLGREKDFTEQAIEF